VYTVITLTDNAPQGLNQSLSSFPLATKVGPLSSLPPPDGKIIRFFFEARSILLFDAVRDGEAIYAYS